jgi:hypothetical protein
MQMGRLAEIAAHPMTFAIGVGVANGVLAAVRDKPVSTKAAAITAAVIAAGELALVFELPDEERPNMTEFAIYTMTGTFLGLAPFVSWREGEPGFLQRTAEDVADWYSERQLGPEATGYY